VQEPPEVSNQAAVAEPLGFTVPFRVAVVVVTAEAETAEREGATGTGADAVMKFIVTGAAKPLPFIALTVNEYGVPAVRPVIV
jgi:hypothetical protein